MNPLWLLLNLWLRGGGRRRVLREHPEIRDPAAGIVRIASDAAIFDPRAQLRAIARPGPIGLDALPEIARLIARGAGAWTHVGASSRYHRYFELARDAMRDDLHLRLWGTPPAQQGDPYRTSPDRRVVVVSLGFVSRYPLVNDLTAADAAEVRHALDSLTHAAGFDVLAGELSWNPFEDPDRTIDPADLPDVANPRLFAL